MTLAREVPELVTVREIEERSGLSDATIYRHIADGRLPVVRFGRTLRVPREEAERFLKLGCA